MKQVLISLVALFALIVGGVSGACAAPYLAANFGYAWLDDSAIKGNGYSGELTFAKGSVVTAAVGNALNNGLRPEVEFGFRTNEGDKLKESGGEGIGVDSDIETLSLMANCYYDILPGSMISPFVGAGIGMASLDAEIPENDGEANVFAYQLAAGVTAALGEKVKIDAQYRLFGTDDPDFKKIEAEYLAHNLLLGLRYSF